MHDALTSVGGLAKLSKRLAAADLAMQPAKRRREHRVLDACSSTPEEEWFEVAKHRDLIDTFVRFYLGKNPCRNLAVLDAVGASSKAKAAWGRQGEKGQIMTSMMVARRTISQGSWAFSHYLPSASD